MNAVDTRPEVTFCDECHRWLPARCRECGQPSHLVCGGGRYVVPLNHDDCQEGLGWDDRHVCEDADVA